MNFLRTMIRRTMLAHPRWHRAVALGLGRGSLEKRVYLSVVRAGDVVCDVGANEGCFTELFASLVGPDGMVHACEPGGAARQRLTRRLAGRTGLARVQVHALALGEAERLAVLHVPGGADGQASLRRHAHGSWVAEEQVRSEPCRVRTLDSLAAEWPRLDFVKCDVEGAELLVLLGARQTCERCAPVLCLEVYAEWMRAFGYGPSELIRELRGLGYDLLWAVDDRVRPVEQADLTRPFNLLCGRSTAHGARLGRLPRN
jgi:FkbM family methyltransferase